MRCINNYYLNNTHYVRKLTSTRSTRKLTPFVARP
nr:MAG TPA: hypothetical protein [Caudoviricetes sp.]